MTTPSQPARRRFAPVPIETTFGQFRTSGSQAARPGPTGEPTPSPSPRTPTPPARLWTKQPVPPAAGAGALHAKPKRHFAPQLIESSRRSRRAGDVGPATKPTDKTDITPYHHHIYAPKSRKRHGPRKTTQSLARRESCDEETAAHVFEMLAREAEKRMLENAALAAYPNSRARAGGAEHFVIREGSDDESPGSQSRQLTGQRTPANHRAHRDSLTEDVGWAFKEMQEHLVHLTQERASSISNVNANANGAVTSTGTPPSVVGTPANALPAHAAQIDRISTLDLDRMSMESPPCDMIWTTNTALHSTGGSCSDSIRPGGDFSMPFITEEGSGISSYARQLRDTEGDCDNDICGGNGQLNDKADTEELLRESAARVVQGLPASSPDAKFRGRNAYAGYRNRDLFASERDVAKARKKSPPMLGKDIVFVKCLSPKQTKLEPQYLWSINDIVEKSHHSRKNAPANILTDKSTAAPKKVNPGEPSPGLWHGLCHTSDQTQAVVPIQRPTLLATPYPPSSPHDPFADAFGSAEGEPVAQEEALDKRLLEEQQKQAAVDKEKDKEKHIEDEFTDRFVTQVYNYLSLGYPAMARDFDEELSKISFVPVADLQANDAVDNNAKGHISLDDDDARSKTDGPGTYNHDGCPRWHALKMYIAEWARQHPDLDSISPLAWGVRERRGSWGL